MCPVCNPVQTWTSSGTDVQKVVSAWVVPETTGVLKTNAKPGEWIVPLKDEPSELDILREENARLREALKLYADPWSFKDKIDNETSIPDFYSETDFGMFAREALKGGE
jgi:hypothetical protein